MEGPLRGNREAVSRQFRLSMGENSLTTPAKEQDRPFRVVTQTGVFVSGHDTLKEAENNAKDRNARAKELKLSVAYSTCANPQEAS